MHPFRPKKELQVSLEEILSSVNIKYTYGLYTLTSYCFHWIVLFVLFSSSDSISQKRSKSGSSKNVPALGHFPIKCTTDVKVRLDVNAVSHYFSTQTQMSTEVINFQSNKPSLKGNPSSSISNSPKNLKSATNPSNAIKTNVSMNLSIH